ncbi:MAG: hypothetical protein ACE5FS_05400 [Paracoccaceae bacterium]
MTPAVAIGLALMPVLVSAGDAPRPSAESLAAFFDKTRAALPCVGEAAALLRQAGYRAAGPAEVSEDYRLQEYSGPEGDVTLGISAETTPLGTQFAASVQLSDPDGSFGAALARVYASRNALPAPTPVRQQTGRDSASWTLPSRFGPTLVVIEHRPATGRTAIYANLAPIRPGTPTGC